ncbi:type III-B CRISPR-associated protein Cas10/Cmr2 [Halonatronum saccharophilum]|uniref:type III-B CRISPR-associated protein Cas10/Cmr2 n=1 Tax=Halonatronum saccharophilum TaxID=150060 RepID=UPI00048A0F36|nr:type III-B CRISPR-associated protein Cas10/Cmr2 [Halonatronum saccharophilum]
MTKKYIGITIGPIYHTLKSAKKTGQLWGGSYIFSYIMKNIMKKFKDERDFIVPCAKDEYFEKGLGAGLFHDRCIFVAEDGDFEDISKTVDDILKDIAGKISGSIGKEEADIESYLQKYFQIYYLEKELREDQNPILELSPYLDSLELQPKFIPEQDTDESYLFKFFDNKKIKNSFLTDDAFGKAMEIKSIPEIASMDLADKLTKDEVDSIKEPEEEFYKKFYDMLEYKEYLKKYHKYYAIVQADGDNMGKVIEKLKIDNNFESYKDFSEKLFKFALKSTREIENYGGLPIFAGGDDLLFFVPVINGGSNIFDLINNLDDIYKDTFEKEIKELEQKPSLSYGVAINYYKYPLYEALESAGKLLFGEAKNYKMKGKTKNAIAVRVLKHSGHYFNLTLNKESKSYSRFRKLLKDLEKDDKFLSSVKYKLANERVLIEEIASDSDKLENYFKNSFKKEIHEKNSNLKDVRLLVEEVYRETDKGQAMELINGILQFISFISGKEGEENGEEKVSS